ncbi:MAG: 3-oxoacyl-[acyl-carrier-protein] synthase III C-terminal domain-containing protein [Myxococcota bacterium]
MAISAGLLSLSVRFPKNVRTNDFWREHYPDVVKDAEQRTLARLWAKPTGDVAQAEADLFTAAMVPYVDDPFRGTKQRRVLADGESVLDLELDAAREALAKAGLAAGDVDLLIAASFLPANVGVGNAPYLAQALGLRGAAWNLETACSSSLVALETAAAFVEARRHRHVLVVVSCTYSRVAPLDDTMSWFLGDGAAAFVVGPVQAGRGVLGFHTIHTGDTCGTFFYDLAVDEKTAQPKIVMGATAKTGKALAQNAQPNLTACAQGAAKQAGVSMNDISLFVFNTPTAWYADFGAKALGVDPSRTVSTYERYANIGPVLMPANLHHAASTHRLRDDDLVLLYSVGSVSSASAAIVRWQSVGLGDAPPD